MGMSMRKANDSPALFNTPAHTNMTAKTEFRSPQENVFATPSAPQRYSDRFDGQVRDFGRATPQSAKMVHGSSHMLGYGQDMSQKIYYGTPNHDLSAGRD